MLGGSFEKSDFVSLNKDLAVISARLISKLKAPASNLLG